MRPSRTSLLALTGFLAASVAWAQEPPRPPRRSKTPPSPRRSRRRHPPPTIRRSPWAFARKSWSRPRSARRPSRRSRPRSPSSAASSLEQQRADDFQDLVPLVPGLSRRPRPGRASPASPCAASTPAASRRRSASTSTTCRSDRAPAWPTAPSSSGDFDTFDIARVEVLRGPQGTLYGASSLGGVIKYVPNRPSTERFEARVLGSAETVDNGDPGYSLTGLVNVPLGDKAAVRASGFYRFDSGFIDSIGNNPVPSLTNPAINVIGGTLVAEGLNSLDRFGGRFAALVHALRQVLGEPGRAAAEHRQRRIQHRRRRPGEPRAAERHSGAVALPVGVQRHEVPGLQRHARLGPGAASLESVTSFGPSSRTSIATWPSRPT